jgi:hypothetical protein
MQRIALRGLLVDCRPLKKVRQVLCVFKNYRTFGRQKDIDLEAQNPNPLQSSLLGNARTSPSASAIVGNISGKRLLEW